MTKRNDSDVRDDASGAGAHNEIIDEGPLPGEDIAAELNEGQERAAASIGGAASVSDLARGLEQQNDRYLRLAAEFDNFRRRTAKEKLEMGARAQAALAHALLESLDDLARVTSLRTETPDAIAVVEGVNLVARKLTKELAAAGLEAINPDGEVFDPALHEAVATRPAESADEDDEIATVFQPGYLFKGQLLRPARVVVKKWQG